MHARMSRPMEAKSATFAWSCRSGRRSWSYTTKSLVKETLRVLLALGSPESSLFDRNPHQMHCLSRHSAYDCQVIIFLANVLAFVANTLYRVSDDCPKHLRG